MHSVSYRQVFDGPLLSLKSQSIIFTLFTLRGAKLPNGDSFKRSHSSKTSCRFGGNLQSLPFFFRYCVSACCFSTNPLYAACDGNGSIRGGTVHGLHSF